MAVEVTGVRLNGYCRTELSLEQQMHSHVTRRRKHVAFVEGEHDEEFALRPCVRHQAEELLGGARIAEEDEHVAIGEYSNVAMESIHRWEERQADVKRDEHLQDLVRY